jgi:hypothetical protein
LVLLADIGDLEVKVDFRAKRGTCFLYVRVRPGAVRVKRLLKNRINTGPSGSVRAVRVDIKV